MGEECTKIPKLSKVITLLAMKPALQLLQYYITIDIFCVCVCVCVRERDEEILHFNLRSKYTVPMRHFSTDFHKHLAHLPQKLSCSPKFQFYNRQFNKGYLKFNYDLKRTMLTVHSTRLHVRTHLDCNTITARILFRRIHDKDKIILITGVKYEI